VYLDLDTVTGATRILSNPDMTRESNEKVAESPEAYGAVLDERLKSESRRYENLYGVDNHDPKNFDLIVDTKTNSPSEASKLIIDAFHKWLEA
jgi:cytidylate kinase